MVDISPGVIAPAPIQNNLQQAPIAGVSSVRADNARPDEVVAPAQANSQTNNRSDDALNQNRNPGTYGQATSALSFEDLNLENIEITISVRQGNNPIFAVSNSGKFLLDLPSSGLTVYFDELRESKAKDLNIYSLRQTI